MTTRPITRCSTAALLALTALAIPFHSQAVDFEAGNTTVTIGGYAKLDIIATDASEGRITDDDEGFGQEFYLPFAVPVEGEQLQEDGSPVGDHQATSAHARESRLYIETATDINGNALGSYVEIDFLTSPDGTESFTNSNQPRMRHYYLTFNDFLLGQTWSTFMNDAALPDTLDFVGPAESTIFIRQAQARYTAGPFQFSVENPETRLAATGGGDTAVETQDGTIPDFVARYDLATGIGDFALAGLARQLTVDESNPDFGGTVDDSAFGYGLSLSGVVPVGSDSFSFAINGGDGIGRYMGFQLVDAVVDGDSIEPIKSYGAFAGYEHLWSDQWSSTFVYGFMQADNEVALSGPGATEEARSVHANLVYYPVPEVAVGIEYLFAEREEESGADGSINRVQFSGQYEF